MAINPNDNPTMAGRITPPDSDYPYGSSKNETSAGAGDGTPYFEGRANDIFGFQQALLTVAGIVPSGSADTALVSQYLESARAIFGNVGLTVFTSGGTFTPNDNAKALLAIAVGGGGGSGGVDGGTTGEVGAAGGGGGGGTAIGLVTAPFQSSYSVTIGAGGSGGAVTPADGDAGGQSSFVGGSTNISASGGGGGGAGQPAGTFPVGGAPGGTGSGGQVHFSGSVGSGTLVQSSTVVAIGYGGGTVFAPPRMPGVIASGRIAPAQGNFFGGGASGGVSFAGVGDAAGENGRQGVVIVIEFFNL